MENSKYKFILASGSPRRKELIGHLKIPFTILALNGPEESHSSDPATFCLEIARSKGDAVFQKLTHDDASVNYFVVSADTIVSLKDKIYGKPKDVEEARSILRELSGKTHSVFTAVSVKIWKNDQVDTFSFVDESKVTFDPITEALMERYLATKDSMDKAGAYGIQGGSLSFISKVEGSYSNVVGFPLSRFVLESEKFFRSISKSEVLWLDLF